jgi:hypothetical protein
MGLLYLYLYSCYERHFQFNHVGHNIIQPAVYVTITCLSEPDWRIWYSQQAMEPEGWVIESW